MSEDDLYREWMDWTAALQTSKDWAEPVDLDATDADVATQAAPTQRDVVAYSRDDTPEYPTLPPPSLPVTLAAAAVVGVLLALVVVLLPILTGPGYLGWW